MTATRLIEPPVNPAERRSVPSPGRGRYVLLVVVLLLSGAFAGGLLFDQFYDKSWLEAIDACQQSVRTPQTAVPSA